MTVITVTVISFTPVIILDLVLKTIKIVYVRKYHSKFLKKYEDFVILFTNCRRTFTLQCHEYNTKYKVILIMLKNVLIRKWFFFLFCCLILYLCISLKKSTTNYIIY
jgi:hypothetical protein